MPVKSTKIVPLMHPIAAQVVKEIEKISHPEKAIFFQRFFKTGPGEYAEGDIFAGLTVPQQREIAKKFINLNFSELTVLLHSKIHEERNIALIILAQRYPKSLPTEQEKIYNFYIKNTKYINNWDLVDISSSCIVGAYLYNKDKLPLFTLANSLNIWERRIAIVATFYFIKNNRYTETIKLAEILLKDEHDLIHKAVGWMLREVGKRDFDLIEKFLRKHKLGMPRTMLRYALEKFPENLRRELMAK